MNQSNLICGTRKKNFTGNGRAKINPKFPDRALIIAIKEAKNDSKNKCREWIQTQKCKPLCPDKSHSIKFVSLSVISVENQDGSESCVAICIKRAIVRCSGKPIIKKVKIKPTGIKK